MTSSSESHADPHADPHAGDATTGPHGSMDDHGADHGHDDHAHADEDVVAKFDVPAWGAGALGVVLGVVVVLALAGKDAITISRKMMGATFGSKAEPGTIRGDFGVSNSFNLIHGSDSPEAAERELKLFFKPGEIVDSQRAIESWVYDLSGGKPE
jgi:nucleoside diphosphate kinase